MFVEDAPVNVGPKFLKGIARQESAEAFRGAQERVVRIGFAVNAPGVGDEVIPKKRHIPGIGGPEAAVVAPGDKREAYDIPDASLKGPVRHAKIARIFPVTVLKMRPPGKVYSTSEGFEPSGRY